MGPRFSNRGRRNLKREQERVTNNALVELGDETVQFSHHSKMDFAVLFFFNIYFNTSFKYLPSSLSLQKLVEALNLHAEVLDPNTALLTCR